MVSSNHTVNLIQDIGLIVGQIRVDDREYTCRRVVVMPLWKGEWEQEAGPPPSTD